MPAIKAVKNEVPVAEYELQGRVKNAGPKAEDRDQADLKDDEDDKRSNLGSYMVEVSQQQFEVVLLPFNDRSHSYRVMYISSSKTLRYS